MPTNNAEVLRIRALPPMKAFWVHQNGPHDAATGKNLGAPYSNPPKDFVGDRMERKERWASLNMSVGRRSAPTA